jgi:hypothetical protein
MHSWRAAACHIAHADQEAAGDTGEFAGCGLEVINPLPGVAMAAGGDEPCKLYLTRTYHELIIWPIFPGDPLMLELLMIRLWLAAICCFLGSESKNFNHLVLIPFGLAREGCGRSSKGTPTVEYLWSARR